MAFLYFRVSILFTSGDFNQNRQQDNMIIGIMNEIACQFPTITFAFNQRKEVDFLIQKQFYDTKHFESPAFKDSISKLICTETNRFEI